MGYNPDTDWNRNIPLFGKKRRDAKDWVEERKSDLEDAKQQSSPQVIENVWKVEIQDEEHPGSKWYDKEVVFHSGPKVGATSSDKRVNQYQSGYLRYKPEIVKRDRTRSVEFGDLVRCIIYPASKPHNKNWGQDFYCGTQADVEKKLQQFAEDSASELRFEQGVIEKDYYASKPFAFLREWKRTWEEAGYQPNRGKDAHDTEFVRPFKES